MQTDHEKFQLETSVEELVHDTSMGRPHVVILGAGASLQAFPTGDMNGNKLPLMCNFVETIGLDSEFRKCGLDYEGKNFEDIYSDLCQNSKYEELVEVIKTKVWDYFSKLELPPNPTMYDHLVLSLRDKDLIATFNWDPFLYYACWRNHEIAELPRVVYLHGNVAIGYCLKDMEAGLNNTKCSKCGGEYVPSQLLFPIKQKEYNRDPFIKSEWGTLRLFLKHAYMLTIFGYSAPYADVEAIKLMKDAWGSPWSRNLEQTEIIDVKPEQALRGVWKDFIHTHHYDVTSDFYKSSIGLFPRRTCEAEWNYTMPKKLAFYPHNPIPKNLGFKELWEWYSPLIEAESKDAYT